MRPLKKSSRSCSNAPFPFAHKMMGALVKNRDQRALAARKTKKVEERKART